MLLCTVRVNMFIYDSYLFMTFYSRIYCYEMPLHNLIVVKAACYIQGGCSRIIHHSRQQTTEEGPAWGDLGNAMAMHKERSGSRTQTLRA